MAVDQAEYRRLKQQAVLLNGITAHMVKKCEAPAYIREKRREFEKVWARLMQFEDAILRDAGRADLGL